MAYCPNCGKTVNAGVNFCESCGFALHQAPAVVQQSPAGAAVERPSTIDFASDPVVRNYPPVPPGQNLPFRLQDGEVILKEFRPKRKVIVKFAFGGIITALFLWLFILAPLSALFIGSSSSGGGLGGSFFLIFAGMFGFIIVLIISISVASGFLGYKKYSYWITHHRTIGRRGIIGYTTDSMPLENVADVIVSRGYTGPLAGSFNSVYPADRRHRLHGARQGYRNEQIRRYEQFSGSGSTRSA